MSSVECDVDSTAFVVVVVDEVVVTVVSIGSPVHMTKYLLTRMPMVQMLRVS